MIAKAKSRLNQIKPSVVFLILAVLIGSFVRLGPVVSASFPMNDGGLFYNMTQELVDKDFRLPESSTYNNLQIPYAYPPLGFFLTGGLQKLTGWELLDIFRILPATFSALSIIAFYLLAKVIVKDDLAVSFSVLAFSCIPVGMAWLVMGGGITRAPGFVFSLLALTSSYLCFTRNRRSDLFLSVFFSTLTVFFHPEAAVHTAAGILIFLVFKGRHKKGFIRAGIILISVILLTSPWWLQVLKYHGLSAFLAASQTGIHSFTNYLNLFLFDITGEYGLTSIGVLAFIGLFFSLSKKKALLPVWLVVTFLVGPRSANLYITPIVAILAGEIILFLFQKFDSALKGLGAANETPPLSGTLSKVFLTILLLQWAFSAMITISNQAEDFTLSISDFNAMEWVRDNTPEESRFLLLSGLHPFMDAASEWFPAVSDRVSVATVQGFEWIEGTDFEGKLDDSLRLQSCILQDLSCVEDMKEEGGWEFDYIFLRKNIITTDFGEIPSAGLSKALSESSIYTQLYETDTIIVYEVNP